MILYTEIELMEDVDFLSRRAMNAGACYFGDEDRDYGDSSNSIVSLAYGLIPPERQVMPSDPSDLAACEMAFGNMPIHRQAIARAAIAAARKAIDKKWGKEKTGEAIEYADKRLALKAEEEAGK